MIITISDRPRFVLTIFVCLCLFTAKAQNSNSAYDKALADSLGSDEYGMKMYTLVILKTGTNATTDKTVIDSLFNGHMQNIGRLAKEGKLVVAGPLQKNEKNYRGIFILNVKTTEDAKTLLDSDPAVKAKLLDSEIYGWYGSAALPNHSAAE